MESVTLTQKRDGKASGSQQLTATTGDDGAGRATFTGVITRHTRRLREEGAAALTHGNRGRRPANAMPDSVITRPYTWPEPATGAPATPIWVSCWVSGRVLRSAGPRSGVSSVGVGLASPRRRRPPAHGIRRQRMPREGMPVQLDGSHHRWLEDRGPRFTLLLEADDATGRMAGALFCREETTHDYFVLLGESGSDPHLHGLERTRARLS